jgi:uncharacterized glyoxalase superfamily metalloenzyme YdcJ
MASTALADKVQMQHRLFAELSSMFGKEVPMYDRSLLANQACNRTVISILSTLYPSFAISDEQLERTSGERHGAIRIGRPDEYRWIGRLFAAFAMEPHNFYDMTSVGAKSQPIIATAFRATHNPEHRVFTSLLQTDYFAPETRARIEAVLAPRKVFSDAAKALIEKGEKNGGLDWTDADALIRESTQRIFKWTASARDHALYKELCDAGFKIAADIACFNSHHLNHLTPNTLCIDLYTSAMKHAMGELPEAAFRARATTALTRLAHAADRDWMRLHFKHLSHDQIDALAFAGTSAALAAIPAAVDALVQRLYEPDLRLAELKHAGFKDTTEGPSWDTPVLLRQDSYKALTEPVEFANPDGSTVNTTHTARFGEIEQRFYATTKAGRSLYDSSLTAAEAADAALAKKDFDAYESKYAAPFKPFPKTLPELLKQGLVYGLYSSTAKGRAAKGTLTTTDPVSLTDPLGLIASRHARVEGLRYEDFLPVSAAGIFASNLNQYGTASTATARPTYTKAMLEEILGKPIIDTDLSYAGIEARSLLDMYADLGLIETLPATRRTELEAAARHAPTARPAEARRTEPRA